jgi:acyl transferase domain-containing protein/acyl carrier protein
VLGLAGRGFGPVTVTDARLLAPIPLGWSFAQAAAIPITFMTAWYALADLAGARPGQKILIHAAAGGVGMAAVSIARHLGLDVYATASPGKWDTLASRGLDPAHIASSRDAGFEAGFAAVTGGSGVDIVLNALAGELTDASLRLLPRGGMFLEMGKTDPRDPGRVAADHPGVSYQAFDLSDAGPVRSGQILAHVAGLLAGGDLDAAPVRCWDVRRAPDAFRFMSQARHTGKIVLTIPPDPAAPRPAGTVLVTGGTGTLGALVARHLAATGRAAGLVLTSRSGPMAPGAAVLAAGLAGAGTGVQVTTCDAADRAQLVALLDKIPAHRPLTGVVHMAGVLDDGIIGSLTPDRVGQVMRPKADAAWHLHQLTRHMDLDWFILFSSSAAAFGGPGQGNYAAANAFLDALAARRRAAGLPGLSLGWGLWADASALTGHLDDADQARMARGGMTALTAQDGLGLLDLALNRDEAHLIPTKLDITALRARAKTTELPPLLRGIVGGPVCSAAAATAGAGADALSQQLSSMTGPDQDQMLLDLVRAHAATVLGHASPDAVESGRPFTDLGFDSLTAVELRNRLHAATGLRLPSTLVFDYPTPVALAGYLRTELVGAHEGRAAAPQARAATIAAAQEPVAIVGIGCRFPGGVRNPQELWQLLTAGTDAISALPQDRDWDVHGSYDPDPDHGGTSYVRAGGFLDEATDFDASFFRISPREALGMDPQQRHMLEVCWEAFEQAGIRPGSLRGSQTGVFVGAWSQGYDALLAAAASEGLVPTSDVGSVISGRVAYAFGLEGPAVTVDTACSSSLVALHLAVQALHVGECTMALAGGVNVMSTPTAFGFGRELGLSPDGRCKAFSSYADGMGMSEGVGVLVLERLSDARRNGHRVLAVVRGSAVNQDGASNGLTAPNGPSQQRVIRAALARAGLSASDVDAVEAHGTGTNLGDPIEAQALLATYGQDRPEGRPVLLGSVKSNIGHAQAAAGAAGVIKMVQALRHGTLPATLHAAESSPHVDWSAGDVQLVKEAVSWPETGQPRRAAVSSFGISGTNVHVVLEAATESTTLEDTAATSDPIAPGIVAWPLSGRTPAGLRGQAARLAEYLQARPGLDPADVGLSLATTRSLFDHRAVVIGAGSNELSAGLTAIAAGTAAGIAQGTAGETGRLVFVFPGQGTQWAGMGRELAATSPVFAARLAECGQALAPHVGWSLTEVIDRAEGLEAAEVVQPVLWAVMVSLAGMWQAAGVTPDAVVGHSQGEIAAACVAGILSIQDAAQVVAVRSRALSGLCAQAGMISVVMPAAGVRELLPAWGDRLSVAAVNGPATTVVSGGLDALAEFEAELSRRRVLRWRIPQTDFVAHSARVEELEAPLAESLAGIRPTAGRVPLYSTVECRWMEGTELDAAYWYANVRHTVRFQDAISALAQSGHRSFIEVSPHPVLTTAVAETVEETGTTAAVVTGTVDRESSGTPRFLEAVAQVHVRGIDVDWAAVLGTGRRIELPTYAFQHQRYWPKIAPAAVKATTGSAGGDGAATAAETRFWAAVEGGDLQSLSRTLAVEDRQRLGEVLPALTSWRLREKDRSATESWRYRVTWVPITSPGTAALSGIWLVVTTPDQDNEDGSLARACLRALSARGAQVTVIEAAAAETGRAALAASITAAIETETVSGVVSLLALDEAPLPGCAPVVTAGLAGTQVLVQALGDAGVGAQLWVLTRGAVAAGAGDVVASPVQGQVWGLGRVAGLEHPDRWGGLVDLPPVLDERAAARLCGILAGCGEDQVAIRGAGVLGRRLERAPVPRGPEGSWRPRGSVLITGGTGAIGGHLARWLPGRGAPRVVLASRSGPAAPSVAVLAAELAAAGTEAAVITCDVGDREQAAGLIGWISAGGPPLSAVMHTAGAAQVTALADTSVADLAGALGAKAAGAVHLDELTRDMDLDGFVLFSSIAATWGSGLNSGYAAANAFLDGLAQQRAAQGLAGTSMAWGAWGGGGMTDEDTAEQLASRGVRLMDPGRAVAALGQVLDGGEGVVTAADVDWARFAPVFTVRRSSPLIAGLPEAAEALAGNGNGGAGGDGDGAAGDESALVRRLAALPRAEQDRMLTDLVRAEAAATLGHASAEDIGAEQAFSDLGFDSLMVVDLRNRLNTATGLSLPVSLLFDYPTPVILAEYLRAEIFQDEATQIPLVEELDKLESLISEMAPDDATHKLITARLQGFISKWSSIGVNSKSQAVAQKIESATDDEIFEFIHREFGREGS